MPLSFPFLMPSILWSFQWIRRGGRERPEGVKGENEAAIGCYFFDFNLYRTRGKPGKWVFPRVNGRRCEGPLSPVRRLNQKLWLSRASNAPLGGAFVLLFPGVVSWCANRSLAITYCLRRITVEGREMWLEEDTLLPNVTENLHVLSLSFPPRRQTILEVSLYSSLLGFPGTNTSGTWLYKGFPFRRYCPRPWKDWGNTRTIKD